MEKGNTKKKTPKSFTVYHVRLKGNDDRKEGYIGVTERDLQERLELHHKKDDTLGTILKSLPREAVEIVGLCSCSRREYALDIAFRLRSERGIGWNESPGEMRTALYCYSCGKPVPWKRYPKGHPTCSRCKRRVYSARFGERLRFKITSPEGEEFTPESLEVFCKEHNLHPSLMRQVAKGKRGHHKRWTATVIKTSKKKKKEVSDITCS